MCKPLRLLYFTQIFIYFSKPLRLLYSLIIYEIVNFSFFTLYSLLLLSFFLYLKSVPIYVIVHAQCCYIFVNPFTTYVTDRYQLQQYIIMETETNMKICIITRRMLSIVGERELRLHSDSHVIFLSRRGCFKYYLFYFVCVCFWLGIYLLMLLPFPLFLSLLFWCAINVNFHVLRCTVNNLY